MFSEIKIIIFANLIN